MPLLARRSEASGLEMGRVPLVALEPLQASAASSRTNNNATRTYRTPTSVKEHEHFAALQHFQADYAYTRPALHLDHHKLSDALGTY